jgi:uncharacterized protein YjiS (DUF1127 family)
MGVLMCISIPDTDHQRNSFPLLPIQTHRLLQDVRQEGLMFVFRAIVPPAPAASGGSGPWFNTPLKDLHSWVRQSLRHRRTRRYLTDVDDCILADLGVSRAQAEFEASRWWWDHGSAVRARR